MKKCLLRFKTGEILRTFSHTLTCLMNMVSKHGLMRIQVSRNIAARYAIGSKKIYIVTYVGKNTCFIYIYFNLRKLNMFTSFCLVCCAKRNTWGGLNDIFLSMTFILLINFFKILYSHESSPKAHQSSRSSAKTHVNPAIWVISEKLNISWNEEHLVLLRDPLKLSHGKLCCQHLWKTYKF